MKDHVERASPKKKRRAPLERQRKNISTIKVDYWRRDCLFIQIDGWMTVQQKVVTIQQTTRIFSRRFGFQFARLGVCSFSIRNCAIQKKKNVFLVRPVLALGTPSVTRLLLKEKKLRRQISRQIVGCRTATEMITNVRTASDDCEIQFEFVNKLESWVERRNKIYGSNYCEKR